MSTQTLKQKIIAILDGGTAIKTGALATVDGRGRPSVRIMTFRHKDLILYSVTSLKSKKTAHVRDNPFVSIEISRDITRLDSDYIVIDAKAEVLSDLQTKKDFWTEHLSVYFSGADDPDYCVMKFTPETIDYMGLETLSC